MKNLVFLILLTLAACSDPAVPKPEGYFRIGLPAREYQPLESDCPFTFEYNRSAVVEAKPQHCWMDVAYPRLRARIQLTYKSLDEVPLDTLLDDAHYLAFKHSVKADGIQEKLYTNPEKKVHGLLYLMAGNAASTSQFFVTDSTRHFLRGVLYYYAEPNRDSIAPVDVFMQEEMSRLMESLAWRNPSP